MNDFPYTIIDVLRINHIEFDSNRTSVRVKCPLCSGNKISKDLWVDLTTEGFRCHKCGDRLKGRGGTSFHALINNMTTKEAYHEICDALGISSSGKDIDAEIERRRKAYSAEVAPSPAAAEASDSEKDKVYQELLMNLNLSDEDKHELLSRGFSSVEIQTLGYATYPEPEKEGYTEAYFSIPKILMGKGYNPIGIPLFYKTKTKKVVTMVKNSGIMIPYKNFYNQITGFQVRKRDRDIDPENSNSKYMWLSSNGYTEGCKPSSMVHYAVDFKWDENQNCFIPSIKGDTIALTEGALKADLAHAISGIPFIAVPGVNLAERAIKQNASLLKSIGITKIAIAYDMDRITNYHVLEALSHVKEIILSEGFEVLNLTWDNEATLLDSTKIILDPNKDFVIPANNLGEFLEKDKNPVETGLSDILKIASNANISQIYLALESPEITPELKKDAGKLVEACKKANLQCKPVFWKLNLKGVDDYYANKARNVKYE